MDIREETRLVVRRGQEYLVSRILDSTEYRWSTSAWDAWGTRRRAKAERMARRTGGELWLFNPVAGQLRRAEWKDRGKA